MERNRIMAYGSPGDDTIVADFVLEDDTIDLDEGFDNLTLSPLGPNNGRVFGVEALVGSNHSDVIEIGDSVITTNFSYDLKAGNNMLVFGGSMAPNVTLNVSNVNTYLGGSGDENVSLVLPRTFTFDPIYDPVPEAGPVNVKMGGGYDVLSYVNAPDYAMMSGMRNLIVSGAEEIVSNASGGMFSMGGSFLTLEGRGDAKITMNAYGDTLQVSGVDGDRAIKLDLTGVESVVGSDAREVIRIDGAGYSTSSGMPMPIPSPVTGLLRDVFINLGNGNDRVEITTAAFKANTANFQVSGVETVLGSAANDKVTLNGPTVQGMSIDLGGGKDELVANTVGVSYDLRLSNVETVTTGDMDDSIVLRSAVKNGVFAMGGGVDTLDLQGSGNSLTVSGVDSISGGAGTDRIVVLDAVGVSIKSGAGDDHLTGGAGNDRLRGGFGADTLIGGEGNDLLVGGAGKDTMTGGAGADMFRFEAMTDSDSNTRDIITDFQVGMDSIDLTDVFDGSTSGFALIGEAAFSASGAAEARFIDATDQFLLDVDGNGSIDFRMTLQGVDGASLTSSDFIWSYN